MKEVVAKDEGDRDLGDWWGVSEMFVGVWETGRLGDWETHLHAELAQHCPGLAHHARAVGAALVPVAKLEVGAVSVLLCVQQHPLAAVRH